MLKMGVSSNFRDFDINSVKEQRQSKKYRHFLIPEQGVRLAVTVPIFMMIGFYAVEVLEPKMNSYVFTWALWCAMTMVLVSSNEMGGVMTDGIRRFCGALITGILATSVVWVFKNENFFASSKWIQSDAIIVAVAGVFVMFFAQVFVQFTGYKRTTVMVCQLFIKCCFVGKANNFQTVWSIIIGVCTGVFMISITSVLIFPRSSSYQAMIQLKLALEKLESLSKLTMHELITASISPNQSLDSNNKLNEISVSMDTLVTSDLQENGDIVTQLTKMMKIEDNTLRKCEEMMFNIYDTLDSMKAHLKASRNEIFVTSRQTKDGPKWILIPGAKIFRCICSNPLPYEELEYVQYNIRRVARHLWAVLLSIDHMWDDTVQQVIKQRYPQEVLPQIHNLTTAVLKDIAGAFPSQYYVSMKNLSRLEMHVEMMLNISNRWRTRAAIKKNQAQSDPLVEQGRQRALKRAATRAASFAKRTPQSIAVAMEVSDKPVVRTRSLAAAGMSPHQSPAQLTKRAASVLGSALASPMPNKTTPNQTPLMQRVLEEEEMVGQQNGSNQDIFNVNNSSRSVRFSVDLDLLDKPSQRSEENVALQPSVFIEGQSQKTEEGDNGVINERNNDENKPILGRGSAEKRSPFLARNSTESNRSPMNQLNRMNSTTRSSSEFNRNSRQMNRMGSIARLVFKGTSLQKEIDPELAQQLIQPAEQKESLGRKLLRQLSRAGGGSKEMKIEVKQGQRKQRRQSAHVGSGIHSTDDILQKLVLTNSSNVTSETLEQAVSNEESAPHGFFHTVSKSFGSSGRLGNSSRPPASRTFRRIESINVSSMIVDVPLVEEQLALSFPETEEGHTQEARWYSFQFQIDELLDALVELHTAINNLLEQHLPKLSLSQKLIDRYQVRQYY